MQRRFVVLVLILLGAATTVASAASAQTATRKPGDYRSSSMRKRA